MSSARPPGRATKKCKHVASLQPRRMPSSSHACPPHTHLTALHSSAVEVRRSRATGIVRDRARARRSSQRSASISNGDGRAPVMRAWLPPHHTFCAPPHTLACPRYRTGRCASRRYGPRPSLPWTTPTRSPPCRSRRRGPGRPAQTGPPRRHPTLRRGRGPPHRSGQRRRR